MRFLLKKEEVKLVDGRTLWRLQFWNEDFPTGIQKKDVLDDGIVAPVDPNILMHPKVQELENGIAELKEDTTTDINVNLEEKAEEVVVEVNKDEDFEKFQ